MKKYDIEAQNYGHPINEKKTVDGETKTVNVVASINYTRIPEPKEEEAAARAEVKVETKTPKEGAGKETKKGKKGRKKEEDGDGVEEEKVTHVYPLFCKKCWKVDTKGKNYFLRKVAEVRIRRVMVPGKPGAAKVQSEHCSVFPHNAECVPYGESSFKGNLEQNYAEIEFPYEEVVGTTFDKLVEKFDEWTPKDPLPPGWKINFNSYEGAPEHRKDVRRYLTLPTAVDWVRDVLSPRATQLFMRRAYLFWIDTSNAVDEYTFDGYNAIVTDMDVSHIPKPTPDKALTQLSFIHSGFPELPDDGGKTTYEDYEDGKWFPEQLCHQPPHHDLTVTTVGEAQVWVRSNPRLQDRSKPGSLQFAAQDFRDISFKKPRGDEFEIVTLKKEGDVMLYWPGDSTHYGNTYQPDEMQSPHLGIHMEIASTLHPWNQDALALDVESIMWHHPEHMDRIDPETKKFEVNEVLGKLQQMLEWSSEDKVFIEGIEGSCAKLVEFLQSTCLKEPSSTMVAAGGAALPPGATSGVEDAAEGSTPAAAATSAAGSAGTPTAAATAAATAGATTAAEGSEDCGGSNAADEMRSKGKKSSIKERPNDSGVSVANSNLHNTCYSRHVQGFAVWRWQGKNIYECFARGGGKGG